MIEAVVSASLMLVVMTFIAQMTQRVRGVLRQVSQQRVAIQELSNQLERLTMLTEDELRPELDRLVIASQSVTILPDAKLTGELIDDEFGKRLVLRLNWLRRHSGQPIEICGWLAPASGSQSTAVPANVSGFNEDTAS
jgi:hypothetical protein